MADIRTFPSKIKEVPIDRPTVSITLERPIIMAHVGGVGATLKLLADYFAENHEFETALEIGEAATKVNIVLKKLLTEKKQP